MTGWYVSTPAAPGLSASYGVANNPTTGDFYICEMGSLGHRIQKLSPNGALTVVAGGTTTGFADGQGTAARFNSPRGICLDPAGNVYVADGGNNRIRKIDPAGNVTTVAGSGTKATLDGQGTAAQFNYPLGLACASDGTLYVVEVHGNCVRKIDTAGNVTTIASGFNGPAHCALSLDQKTLYLADQVNNAIQTVNLTTKALATYHLGTPSSNPIGVAVHPVSGWVYATYFGLKQVFEIAPAVTPAYNGSAPVGSVMVGSGANGNADGTGATASFTGTAGIAFNSSGEMLLADFDGARIRKIAPTGIILRDRVITEVDSNVVTVTIPAGVKPGDQLLVRLSHPVPVNTNAPQTTTCSDPTMQLLSQAAYAAKGILVEVWGKFAVSGDTGKAVTFTVPSTAATYTEIVLAAYYNASTNKLFTLGPASTGNSSSPPFTYTLDSAEPKGLAVLLGTAQAASGLTWSTAPPAGFSYRGQVNVSANTHTLALADGPPPVTAGAKTWTWNANAADYLTHVALVPAPQGTASLTTTVTLQATSAAVPPPKTSADDGTFTESVSVNVLAAGDTGQVTEASAAALIRASTDTGVLDEAAIVTELPLTSADQATVAEAASPQGSIVRGDAGTFTDAAAPVRVDTSGADTGLFVERVTDIGGGTTPVEAADGALFTGEETVLAVGAADTALLTGEQAFLVEIVHAAAGADTGYLVESGSVVGGDQYLSAADTLTAADQQTLWGSGADTDSGAFADAQTVPVDVTFQDRAGADTATVTDSVTRVGIRPDTDTATVTDAGSVVAFDQFGDGDTAAATDEAVLIQVTAGDTGSVVESAALFETLRAIDDPDTGRFRDRLSILLRHDPTNNGELEAADQALVGDTESLLFVDIADVDTGAFAEAGNAILANRSVSDGDQATFTESQVTAEVVTGTDTGVVDEAAIVRGDASPGSDDMTGVEGDPTIVMLVADAATVTDKATSRVDTADADTGVLADDVVSLSGPTTPIEDADTGVLADDVVYVGVPIAPIEDADAGSITEQATHAEFSRVVVAADTGQLADSAELAVADEFLTTADTATAVDNQTLQVNVADADSATSIELELADDGTRQYQATGDTGRVTDRATLIGVHTGTDTATAAETEVRYTVEVVDPPVGVWDRAGFTDAAVSLRLRADDAASITDQTSDVFESRRTPNTEDSGRLRDRLSILLMSDPAAGLSGLHVDDQGTFNEVAGVPGNNIDLDNGALTDAEMLFAAITDSDAATVVAETEDLFAAPQDADSARLVIEDSRVVELVSPVVGQDGDDSAAFAETLQPVIVLSDGDSALLTDTPDATVGPLAGDSAAVIDDSFTVGLAGDDTAALVDTGSPVIALSVAETGSLAEPSAQVGVAVEDTAALTDVEAVFVTVSADDLGAFGDAIAGSDVQVPAADIAVITDNGLLSAGAGADDSGVLADAQDLLAAVVGADTAVLADAGDLLAAAQDTDAGSFTESSVILTDTGLVTADTALIIDGQVLVAEVLAGDTGVYTDTAAAGVGLAVAEIGLFTDGQALSGDPSAADIGRFTEAALLFTDTGIGAFTGDNGQFTESASLATWPAFVAVSGDEFGVFAETQSAYRSRDLADYLDERPGSMLKVNVTTRQVDMSSYFDDDEYPLNHALPEQARAKLDAFAGNLAPPAAIGDLLEDTNFHYRYLSRWVTPNRRETGWFLVAWRRSPDGPIEWLA